MSTDAPASPDAPSSEEGRTFLVVLDQSVEFKTALRFACRRAMNTGGNVALFHAVPQSDYHHFAAIDELMQQEAKTDAERRLQHVAAEVHRLTGQFPALHLRPGDTIDQLQEVIAENPSIDMLVLGARTGPEGPGPIVSALSGKLAGKILIPITIVPGDLSEERLDALT